MTDSMYCSKHPYANIPGGICPLCLQEKLGKLVSSSFPPPKHPPFSSSSSSSPPSFGSESTPSTLSIAISNSTKMAKPKPKTPFPLAKKKQQIESLDIVFKRSKSIATPNKTQFLDYANDNRSKKRNGLRPFWHVSSKQRHSKPEDSEASRNVNSSDRKVSRSRSVGCGSRSFSGEIFDRISTGFGDCTLRRVGSQREGSNMKERVKCGGIFSGFVLASSSSSSSSYWASSEHVNGRETPSSVVNGRSKSWVWALASPIRAFNKPSSKNGVKGGSTVPDLNAIPSLLTMR